MPEYRRIFQKGGTYFFTIVTHKRQKIFSLSETRSLFLQTVEHVRNYHPFTLIAYCIMPDHIHFMWQMLQDDADYSMRIGQIKRLFSKQYISKYRGRVTSTISRTKRREMTIWQRRFWEHMIRDDEDLNQHIDYIHYNPVKHGLVDNVRDWKSSSFHDYVNEGYYDLTWGETYRIDDNDYQFGE